MSVATSKGSLSCSQGLSRAASVMMAASSRNKNRARREAAVLRRAAFNYKARTTVASSTATTFIHTPSSSSLSIQQQQWFGTHAVATSQRRQDSNAVETLQLDDEWLPPAYRPSRQGVSGSTKSSSEGSPSASFKHSHHHHGSRRRPHGTTTTRATPSRKQVHQHQAQRAQKKLLAQQRAAAVRVQSDLDRLAVLTTELHRLWKQYRGRLSATSTSEARRDKAVLLLSTEQQDHAARNSAIHKFVKELQADLDELGQVAANFGTNNNDNDNKTDDDDDDNEQALLLDQQVLLDSDNVFRALCRVLQDVVHACTTCYKHETERDTTALIAYAETCFLALHQVRAQRAQLFANLQQRRTLLEFQKQHRQALKDAKSPWMAPLNKMVSFITKSISQIAHAHATEQNVDDLTCLAHLDDDLAPSQQSLRLIVESMALAAGSQLELDNLETRAVALLQTLPAGSVPESLTILSVLEILCRAGTLEAARECTRIFNLYESDIPHLPFSLVLRGFLQASRNETIPERKRQVAQELLQIVHERWRNHFPRHQEERIAQGASVLQCIAVSGMSRDEKIKMAADKIVRRVFGGESYKHFVKSSTSISGKVEAPYVPIVNFRACVYATSGDPKNIRSAKSMINNILPHEADGESHQQYMKYPNVNTINTVFGGIVRMHQERRKGLDEADDLVFCESILDFCMSRRESGVWPNTETFELIMNLYTTLKPANVGQRMEDLLSYYETRVYMSKRSRMKIPLATYNRVIWGIWEEAKAPQPRRSSQRALALLEKLEMLSTPLLLSRKEVLKMQNPRTWELYQFELKPSTKTYEMVLDVCADTAAPEEYEMAARVASTVGNRLLGLDDFKEKSIDKIQTCLDRLESGSEFVGPMTELVVQLKAKRTAEAS